MALYTTWSDANKQTDSGLMATYVSARDAPVVGADGWFWYKFERHRTKTFRYVGMTESAAKSCAATKYQQYMREYAPWTFASGAWTISHDVKDRYFLPVADVSVDHEEGMMWTVTISIDETCIAYERYAAGDPATGNIATMENMITMLCNTGDWEYDE